MCDSVGMKRMSPFMGFSYIVDGKSILSGVWVVIPGASSDHRFLI